MSTGGIGKSYDEFLQSIQARGMKTTGLGNGEANFADYANALSSGLKEELLQSIGDEAGDKELQAKVASLFGGKSVMQSADIQRAAKAAGLSVSVQYTKTSYIVDNKQDGHYDKDVTNGSIAVYTFSDGKSTIKIADANGNGALEAEEIFMNEILGDVTGDIGVSGGAGASGASGPSALDIAKMQQDILLKQIEESKKAQEEAFKRMDELSESLNEEDEEIDKTGAKKDKKEDDEGISQRKFEKLVLEEAVSKYHGYNGGSIKAIENAISSVEADNKAGFDVSSIDVIELARQYAKEIDRIDEENAKKEDDSDDSAETNEPVNEENFFKEDPLKKKKEE